MFTQGKKIGKSENKIFQGNSVSGDNGIALAVQSCSALVKFRPVGLLGTTKGICNLNQAAERCGQSVKSEEVNFTMPRIINALGIISVSPICCEQPRKV